MYCTHIHTTHMYMRILQRDFMKFEIALKYTNRDMFINILYYFSSSYYNRNC